MVSASKQIRRSMLALLCTGCVYFPPFEPPRPTFAIDPDRTTRIGHKLADNSIRASLIEDARAALSHRIDLINAADKTLDLQYFIWQNDATGILLIDKVLAAADRGVRVRALLDDIQLEGLVTRLAAFDEHPNIEVRIFNPFSVRWRYRLRLWRLAEFAIDGNRLNHRMHNKLLVADNQVAIVGGRNIGDDYFGRSTQRNFIDLDLMLSGNVVAELSAGFDTYWNSRWAYPVDALVNLSIVPDDLEKLRERIATRLAPHAGLALMAHQSTYAATLEHLAKDVVLYSAATIIDDPSVAWLDEPNQLDAELRKAAARAEREVLVVTPYLIPTSELIRLTGALIDRGVRIEVVTNSLETNDVVIAQAAYSRYRRRIVEAGIELYEMRADAADWRDDGAEDLSLHQKYIVIDGETVFIGSMNLDPRSLYVNTELGVLLTSKVLASKLRVSFHRLTHPENAWHIRNTADGLVWASDSATLRRQPAKSWWQRLRHWFFTFLPVSRQL